LTAKRSYHHGNLRHALLAAALKEIARAGPDAFSLREVARRAGVSPNAVYRHFTDKDDLLAAVAAECAERLSAVMDAALVDAPDDPLDRYRALGIAYVQFAVKHPEHFRALGVATTDRRPDPMRTQFDMSEALLRAQAAGTISNAPVELIMLAAASLTHGLAKLIVEGRLGEVDAERAKQLAINVTAVLGAGLVPRREPWDDVLSGMRIGTPAR
jgi:AcrR family transcriptional regulator